MAKQAQVQRSDERALCNALTNIDALAQEITSNIEALCEVTLMAMRTPDFWKYPANLVQVLTLITARAQDLGNCINAEAESHGCNWIDQGSRDDESSLREAIRAAQMETCHG